MTTDCSTSIFSSSASATASTTYSSSSNDFSNNISTISTYSGYGNSDESANCSVNVNDMLASFSTIETSGIIS